MDKSLKRIVAFALDILLVTFVISALTKWTGLDPYQEKYNAVYGEYMSYVEDASNSEGSVEIDEDKVMKLNYQLYEYRVFSSSASMIGLLLYFGLTQWLLKGQTIGKKVMNLQVVSNKDKKLNIGHFLIRTIVLNNIIFSLICLVGVYFTNYRSFYSLNYVVSLLQSAVYMINIIMIIFRKDNRGLHDMIAGTKVIDLKPLPVIEEPVLEKKAEVIPTVKDKKETVKKKTNKKKTIAKK